MSLPEVSHQLVIGRTNVAVSRFPEVPSTDLLGFHARRKDCLMRIALFLFWPGPSRLGGTNLARFAHLSLVGKPAGDQLVSPADLPTTTLGWIMAPTYDFSVVKSCRLAALLFFILFVVLAMCVYS